MFLTKDIGIYIKDNLKIQMFTFPHTRYPEIYLSSFTSVFSEYSHNKRKDSLKTRTVLIEIFLLC